MILPRVRLNSHLSCTKPLKKTSVELEQKVLKSNINNLNKTNKTSKANSVYKEISWSKQLVYSFVVVQHCPLVVIIGIESKRLEFVGVHKVVIPQ